VERFCTEMKDVDLASTDLLRAGDQVDLKFRIRVNTVSPEQARRTRQWLEPSGEGEDSHGGIRVDFGDVIDFFFNIYKPQERSGWIDLGTYTPRFTGQLILEEVR
jgi:hypothetical protein